MGLGCRKPLDPNIDRNIAPETWITAAPFDTATIIKGEPPPIVTIPVRFHLYWAASDRDGAVSGFYWAVTETLPLPPDNESPIPPLPGPKPGDYRFTTKTDSIFIFRVAEDVPDRKHVFYIYSVDNLGKPDPTPARFIFNAFDQFPPIPQFLEAKAIGTVYSFSGQNLIARRDTFHVTGYEDRRPSEIGKPPRDTVPSGSTLMFKWSAKLQVPGTVVTGWRYKLDEPELVAVAPSVTSVTYNSGIPPDNVPPIVGTKVFRIRAVDQAEGSSDSTRRFQLNFSPDTWYSGPDLNSPSLLTKPITGEKYLSYSGGGIPPGGITGSLVSRDSVLLLPALRPERKTFFEIWNDTIFARSEFDTVHMNSIVLIHTGGFDRDSRYDVQVNDFARGLPDFPAAPHPVLDNGPANGSPIGFQGAIEIAQVPRGLVTPAFSNLFPFFNPNSSFGNPRLGYYRTMFQAGKAYALVRAIDGDRGVDKRVGDNPRLIVEAVDNGAPDPAGLRRKVLVFYVDRPPELLTNEPLFFPRPAAVDTFSSPLWDMRFPSADSDPFEQGITPAGSKAPTPTLRLRVTVFGLDEQGDSLMVPREDEAAFEQVNDNDFSFPVPPELAGGNCIINVQLCDCRDCENSFGQGRCINLQIPVYYRKFVPNQATSSNVNAGRPGLETPPGRSE